MAKYILFDLDGTLTDPKVGITKSVQYALRKFGIAVENLDDLCSFIGPPLRDSFKNFYGLDDAAAEKAIGFYREYFPEKGIFENDIYDGTEDMLKALKADGKTVILATSKPTVYAERILKHFNIYEHFAFVGGSELNGERSKKCEVIKYVLEQNNIADLNEAVMVGDREYDILGAKEIGIMSIGVLYGYGSYEELYNAKADIIVSNVGELSQLLASLDLYGN